jgi:hypothetical protein
MTESVNNNLCPYSLSPLLGSQSSGSRAPVILPSPLLTVSNSIAPFPLGWLQSRGEEPSGPCPADDLPPRVYRRCLFFGFTPDRRSESREAIPGRLRKTKATQACAMSSRHIGWPSCSGGDSKSGEKTPRGLHPRASGLLGPHCARDREMLESDSYPRLAFSRVGSGPNPDPF